MTSLTSNEVVFGARASIVIQFDGTLEALAAMLAEKFSLKSFEIDTDMYPPHQSFAMTEALGWYAWLEEGPAKSTKEYHLLLETEELREESFSDQRYDLSPWFARMVSLSLDMKAQPATFRLFSGSGGTTEEAPQSEEK